MLVRQALAICGFALLAGCASNRPPLPKQASLEHGAADVDETDFASLVPKADIIYFPAERAASGGRSEPAALLLDALQRDGSAFGIAWDLIDASQQPLLDELRTNPGSAREELIARLELETTGRAREHCRAVLRDARFATLRHIGLQAPPALLEKIAAGEVTADDRTLVPTGFSPPPGAFEAYTASLSSSAASGSRAVAAGYRAQLLSQQFKAEQIVRYFEESGQPGKLLVFIQKRDLATGQGVPYYVAQKTRLRQLVLESAGSASGSARLLTLESGPTRRALQIVNRAPGAAGD